MTRKRITIIDGHPDPDPARFVHALAACYAEGALSAGHAVRRIDVAALDFDLVGSRRDWEGQASPPDIAEAQEDILWADHLVILYPLWLGDVPARLKGFFEQVFRPGFAFVPREAGFPEKKLKGRSAHIVVTMGMPAIFYRFVYGAHSVKSLERNILKFVGIAPVHSSLIGNIDNAPAKRAEWLETLATMGRTAA